MRRHGHQAYTLYGQHKFTEAVTAFLAAAHEAELLGDYEFTARDLINAGGIQLLLFRYQDALSTMERARKAAEKTGDNEFIAIADSNMATLYLQMGNVNGAAVTAARALSLLRENHPQHWRILTLVAQVRAQEHKLPEAEALIQKAINEAYRGGDMDSVGWSWDFLGYQYEQHHRLPEADHALTESLRIREMFHSADLGSSFYHLAQVRSAQGDRRSAAALLNSAVRELKTPGNATPAWNIYFERGRLLSSSGDQEGAWKNLGKAVELARDWRAEVVANEANRTTTEEGLSELYSFYIEVGNTFSAAHGQNFARQTFEAAEENRAASLRALAERETGWHTKLPAAYWDTLTQLQAAERASFPYNLPEQRAEVSRLRAALDEMEAVSGVPHTFASAPASATQKKLDADTVLLSFQLGDRVSWLWAVTHDDIQVFRLPARAELATKIHKFYESVRRGAPEADHQGSELYTILFAGLPERFSRPERWLFSLDQELFSLPMPALVVRFANSAPVYLGAVHALEATPGALMFAASRTRQSFKGPMLAIGDGVYNRADSRFDLVAFLHAGLPPFNRMDGGDNSDFQFARLWGAAGEINSVEKTWSTPGSMRLSGFDVSRERLWKELERKPAVIHFATHILEANDQLHTGWIALSLNSTGHSEFLSPPEISAHKLNSSLVVLNGCSSGNGEIRAASGLMGLTRAWIASGASDVLATRWPGPDDTGEFFTDFYRELKQNPDNSSAFALREACRKSIDTGGWRAKPQFWASYFLTGIN